MPLTVLCRLLARAQCVIFSEVHSFCSTINMPIKCVNSSDEFCCICSEVTFKSRRRSFTPLIKKFCEYYFGYKVGDEDKSWAPHFCCVTCARLLAAWAKGSRFMPFAIPMVWREPTDHVSDCYFRLTSITGVTAKSKHTEFYTPTNALLYTIKYWSKPFILKHVKLTCFDLIQIIFRELIYSLLKSLILKFVKIVKR